MDRFYGYNRDDYYFKTSCREAFGSEFDSYQKPISMKEKLSAIIFVASIIMILASIGSFL